MSHEEGDIDLFVAGQGDGNVRMSGGENSKGRGVSFGKKVKLGDGMRNREAASGSRFSR